MPERGPQKVRAAVRPPGTPRYSAGNQRGTTPFTPTLIRLTLKLPSGCFAAAICNYLEALTVGEAFSRWGTDEEALLYNILDLNVPGTGKASLPPTGGAACGVFQSPLYP